MSERGLLQERVAIACDRCPAALTLTSTSAGQIAGLDGVVGDVARLFGWSIGKSTADGIGRGAHGVGDRDLCPGCRAGAPAARP